MRKRWIVIILLLLSTADLCTSPKNTWSCSETQARAESIAVPSGEVYDTSFVNASESTWQKSYLNHSPISIKSDADFAAQKAAEGWAGDGTQTNPYVIEGYNITHSGINLEVVNVSSHFIIRDCLILSPGTPPLGGYDTGIAIANSSNGIITNNVVRDGTGAGVFVGWTDCTVVNNEFYNNSIGIMFYNSSGSALHNDIVESVDCCVQIWDSIDCNVSFNTMTSDNDGVEFWDDSAHCTVTHNDIDSQDVGISISGNADSHVIAFNEIQGGNIGILAEAGAGWITGTVLNCSFLENTIRSTSGDGITSYGCQYCAFTYNIIIGCSDNGITFYGTDLCTVLFNEIRNNGVGISHQSGFDNEFYGNLLDNYNVDAIDNEAEFENVWDNGAGIGNCWTYPESGGSHNIPGRANNVDHFPLLKEDSNFNRPTIASTPDLLTELGESATLVWVAWSGPGTYTLLLDGSELETDHWGGSGALSHEFEPGTLGISEFTFVLYEETGDTATDTVLVSVLVPPETAQLVMYSLVGLMIAVVVISEVSRDARFKRLWHRRKLVL